MNAMGRVLLICYYFPPMGGAGVNRPMNLAKYLPDKDIACDVLTVKPVAYRHYEPELVQELEGVDIYRAGSRDPQRLMYLAGIRRLQERTIRKSRSLGSRIFPDSKVGWVGPAVRLGKSLIRRREYDAIISTSPPVSCHLVGRELHRRMGIPWIADFRDLWTAYSIEDWYSGRASIGKARNLLAEIGREAAVMTAVNKTTADYVGATHVIRNAFDHGRAQLWRPPKSSGAFQIGLLGTIDVRCPAEPLLALLSRLREVSPAEARSIELVQVGDVYDPPAFRALLDRYGFRDQTESHGIQSRSRTIELLSTTSALYISIAGPSAMAIIPGRVYDMIASGRPLLVSAPNGSELARLAGNLPLTVRFESDDQSLNSAAHSLAGWIQRWAEGEWKTQPLPEYAQPYSSERMAESFADVVKRL